MYHLEVVDISCNLDIKKDEVLILYDGVSDRAYGKARVISVIENGKYKIQRIK